MTKTAFKSAACALLLTAGCGGGGGAVAIVFTLLGLSPTTSLDLNGGDLVTITGTNFQTAGVASVRFGGTPGQNLQVPDEQTLTIVSPPAPGGAAGAVTIEVFSLQAGSRFHPIPFVYVAPASPPAPASIFPTAFTPTGAQTFTIQGSSLGPSGGTAQVTFAGIGTVTANVSFDTSTATGVAPLSQAPPPAGGITVSIDNGVASADVPTQVTYNWTAPQRFSVPSQTVGNASRPVRLSANHAVLCTAGPDNVWRTVDDDIVIIQPFSATPVVVVNRGPGVPVGYLDAANSIPAILDGNRFCVYSVGPDGVPATVDDRVTYVTNAQVAPAVQDFAPGGTPSANPFATIPNTAPLGRISANRVGYLVSGPDATLGTPDDELRVMDFATIPPALHAVPAVGACDTGGPASFSVPYSPDGDTVFVMVTGVDLTPGTRDDILWRVRISQLPAGTLFNQLSFMLRPPVALSPTLLAGPAGQITAPGTAQDVLSVVNDTGLALSETRHALGSPLNVAALRPFVRTTAGVGLALSGLDGLPGNSDDLIRVYTDPLNGVFSDLLPAAGTPLLAPMGSGDIIAFGTGPDLAPGSIDDVTLRIRGDGTSADSFVSLQPWGHTVAALADTDRSFAPTVGGLIVHQTLALGTSPDALVLPISALPLAPVTGFEPFVPIGPGWGAIQSPGLDGVFQTPDDHILVVSY